MEKVDLQTSDPKRKNVTVAERSAERLNAEYSIAEYSNGDRASICSSLIAIHFVSARLYQNFTFDLSHFRQPSTLYIQ